MWFIEQKIIIFQCKTDVRDERALPEPARANPTRPSHDALLTAYFSNILKDTSLKLLHKTDTGLNIVVSTFHRDFLIISEVIVLFAKTDFCQFYTHFCV